MHARPGRNESWHSSHGSSKQSAALGGRQNEARRSGISASLWRPSLNHSPSTSFVGSTPTLPFLQHLGVTMNFTRIKTAATAVARTVRTMALVPRKSSLVCSIAGSSSGSASCVARWSDLAKWGPFNCSGETLSSSPAANAFKVQSGWMLTEASGPFLSHFT